MKEIKLSNVQTREQPLFCSYVWHDSNSFDFDALVPGTNIKHMLFLSGPDSHLVKVYYSEQELSDVFKTTVTLLNADKSLFDKLKNEFHKSWQFLKPYADKEKLPETIAELQMFANEWRRWWTPMAFMFVLPNQESLDQTIRDESLRIRTETEYGTGALKDLPAEFVLKHHPGYSNIAYHLTPEEVNTLQQGPLSDEVIQRAQERRKGVALIHGQLISIDGLDQYLNNHGLVLEDQEVGDTKEVKGSSAFPGTVIGRVKVVLLKEDISKLAEGDILVTHMTSPDHLVGMQKAAAFVTDEGGITCHAAIIARELKKPCIVGSKVATKVLKDGDMVEVDADNGVVRKI